MLNLFMTFLLRHENFNKYLNPLKNKYNNFSFTSVFRTRCNVHGLEVSNPEVLAEVSYDQEIAGRYKSGLAKIKLPTRR